MQTASSSPNPKVADFRVELHAFLERLPSELDSGRLQQLYAKCHALYERAPEAAGERFTRVRAALAELREGLKSGAARAYLMARYEEAARAYEHWQAARRAVGQERADTSLAPLKGARSWFHIAMGVLAAVLYQFVITRAQATTILVVLCAVFGTLEVTRRIWPGWNDILVSKVFHTIARPREYYRVNSATWYLFALAIVTPLFSKPAVLVGVLVLAFGDPAAAWIGKSIGKRKLVGNKSLEGSLAFFVAGAIAAGALLVAFYPALPLERRLLAALVASLLGALAELFSGRVDDNFAVPVAATLAAALVL